MKDDATYPAPVVLAHFELLDCLRSLAGGVTEVNAAIRQLRETVALYLPPYPSERMGVIVANCLARALFFKCYRPMLGQAEGLEWAQEALALREQLPQPSVVVDCAVDRLLDLIDTAAQDVKVRIGAQTIMRAICQSNWQE